MEPRPQDNTRDEDVAIAVTPDEMTARLTLLPPEGEGALLTMATLRARIAAQKITYGIDETVLERVLSEREYNQVIEFAHGTPPIDGQNGAITLHFGTEHGGMPTYDQESDRVDFKQLDLFENVTEGQLLATRTPATQGEKGYTVKGRALTPRGGREARMPSGTKVRYNDDRTEMYAACSGRVDLHGESVHVSNVYEVRGDVDLSIGNISFDGDVVVHGNVISDLEIRATGNVTIYGAVQRSAIYAGGDVLIANGLQGMDGGLVETEGKLTAKYIERGIVRAQTGVLVDQITHSTVECRGEVLVKGKHGTVVGGIIRARDQVVASVIGSINHTRTRIEVGVDPASVARMSQLATQIAALDKQIEECEKICHYLQQRTGGDSNPAKLRTVIQGKMQRIQQQQTYRKEYDELKQETDRETLGRIHVLETAYPEVSISIVTHAYKIQNGNICAATFRLSDKEVVFGPCEYTEHTSGARRSR